MSLIMKLTKIFLLSLSLFNIALPTKANPIFLAQESCQATVNDVINQIKNKGVSHVRFEVEKSVANEYHDGNPTQRNDILNIILGGYMMSDREHYQVVNILYSSVLMNAWANEIVKSCGNTAVVSFGENQTDWIMQYAIQEDGKTKERECLETSSNDKLAWNLQYCL